MNLITKAPLASLAGQTFDVIVIGGGITGAGVAQDAASRGLSTLLIEKGDFASGTSSKSTKLIHGGLRYLQNLQFSVVLESVRERQVQKRLAPHMVHSLPFIIPLYRRNWFNNMKWEAGLWVYDLMAGFSGNRFHKRISREEVLRLLPGIDRNGLTGGIVYYDGRTDDARHTLEVIKSACAHGAIALNYTLVDGLVRRNGKVQGVRLKPASGGDTVEVFGRAVVNATGVWTQKTAELSGGKASVNVSPAKGVHITLPASRLPIKSSLLIPTGGDGRFCFAVPWYDVIVIGTTDTPYAGDLDRIEVEDDEVRYILSAVNTMFPNARVREDEVTGRFAGLRPLITNANSGSTTKVSRRHRLELAGDGLFTIAGGKLTTYRCMAKDTVDLIVKTHPALRAGSCKTEELMLGGWTSAGDYEENACRILARAQRLGLTRESAGALLFAYGKRADAVCDLIEADASLAAPIADGHPFVMAQVVYAAEAEGALTLDDVLSRRIRLSIIDAAGAEAAAEKISRLLAARLGWSEEARLAQVAGLLQAIC